MTEIVSEKLAQALADVGLKELAEMAKADMFHDFKSPYDMPVHKLVKMLDNAAKADSKRAPRILALRTRVMKGDFDA